MSAVHEAREVTKIETPKSLLVVDDSKAEREIMLLTLGAAFPAAEVLTAAHPLMAKQMCADRRFDCVLTDYNMPDMDGVALAGELIAATAYLPIILMTSVGDEMLAAKALRSGISDYLPKSRITTESIHRTVERSIQACGQARLIDEQRGELENFAYALAHDFKQPIRQIVTFTQMISDEIQIGEAGEVHNHLTFLGEAARRLGKLVDVMSQYTLLNQPPELADVDLNRVLASVRASIAPYLAERGGEFVAPSQAPTIRGNETLMTQVLQNLVMNGLQYNRSSVPRVEVAARSGAGHWTLEISDNGLGIEAEYLAEIFKPLFRLHAASEYAGSGLGLTLARKAVLAQDGAIWCESPPGRGSVFHVRLPAAQGTRRTPQH
ncbi:MAG: Phytochrome, two-component sensor histidine kinase [Phenylobacterium sp.]|nr:Phytochrome, two-component sensor histidine kinase [Phenylobacterium sp.]